MSEKKDQEYFGDGMAEELIDTLTKVPELHVPSRTSSFYFKGKQKGGTRLTRNLCALLKRPYINVRETPDPVVAAEAILKFIVENNIVTLNVAGPRLSGWAGGHAFALRVIGQVIETVAARSFSANADG